MLINVQKAILRDFKSFLKQRATWDTFMELFRTFSRSYLGQFHLSYLGQFRGAILGTLSVQLGMTETTF